MTSEVITPEQPPVLIPMPEPPTEVLGIRYEPPPTGNAEFEYNTMTVAVKEEVYDLRRRLGMTDRMIAQRLQVPEAVIKRVLEDYSKSVKANLNGVVTRAFAEQVDTLNDWLGNIKVQIAKKGMNRELLEMGIKVFERMSKLLGLDKAMEIKINPSEWLATASDAELVAYAKRIGMEVPEGIKLLGN